MEKDNKSLKEYAEYCSYGPGASPEMRIDYSHQLNDEETNKYSIKMYFKDGRLIYKNMTQ